MFCLSADNQLDDVSGGIGRMDLNVNLNGIEEIKSNMPVVRVPGLEKNNQELTKEKNDRIRNDLSKRIIKA